MDEEAIRDKLVGHGKRLLKEKKKQLSNSPTNDTEADKLLRA
jgi:hypothetical protein